MAKWYLLRWLVAWAMLVDGILGVLLFGAWGGPLTLTAESAFLEYSVNAQWKP